MKKTLKKLMAVMMTVLMVALLAACGAKGEKESGAVEDGRVFKIGICNYVDDASLNQICENIESRLAEIGEANDVTFEIIFDNAQADSNVLSQIVSKFIDEDVDLMIGVATPVAMQMQGATSENNIPVVFAAVSDPISTGLVADMDAPGANITGTSDLLNTDAIMELIVATNPEIKKVGLLYDKGQDSSATPIAAAKEYFESKNIEVIEKTGTNVNEIQMAANELVEAGVEAVFTPTDNTVMTAELSIYEIFKDAKIPHFCGADSFALNGAYLGFGVNYADLGKVTADMVGDILIKGLNPAEVPVVTFDNGIATINEEMIEALEFDFEALKEAYGPFCSAIQTIQTAESFE